MPLAISTAPRRALAATERSFLPAGNAAPPRPGSPDRSTSAISALPRSRTGPYLASWAPSPRTAAAGSSRGSPGTPDSAASSTTGISSVTQLS